MPFPVVSEERISSFIEAEFVVRTLQTSEELSQAYKLRHRVFAETLKWVPKTEDGEEMDMYDLWGRSIGVIDKNGKLHGLARLLPSSGTFMLERDLHALLPSGHVIRKECDTAEITRLAIDPDIKDKGLSARLMLTLIKGIYHWALENSVRYLYLEVDHRFFRVLNAMGISCKPLGPPVALSPAGTLSIAAIMDIVQCEEILGMKRPQVMEWMATVRTTRGNIVRRTTAECTTAEENFAQLEVPDGEDSRTSRRSYCSPVAEC